MVEQRGYRSSRREQQARRTLRRILDAATAVFLERGYAGATMRAIAAAAGVAVPTVELAFGTKARLLKAAIDVAIAGDDEPVSMIDREWAAGARAATDPWDVLSRAGYVIEEAQSRSAGLVLAVFEGAPTSPDLGALADQLAGQRAVTARWIVDALIATAPLRTGWTAQTASDTIWVLMDPAVFVRLVRDRGWSTEAYRDWWIRSAALLVETAGPPHEHTGPPHQHTGPPPERRGPPHERTGAAPGNDHPRRTP
jgi:AcrR family transcriptional regulator